MRRIYWGIIALLAVVVVLAGCGASNSQQKLTSGTTANVYVTGEDAPLPSVLAFQINIDSLKLSNGTSTVTLESPGTVEFSRLLGLRTLLAVGSIPTGTYTSAQLTLSSPVISYLDMSTTPPSVKTLTGSLGSTTVNVALNPPVVVAVNGRGGVKLHFDLRNSVVTDGSGQMTGQILPNIDMRGLAQGDPDAEIDELRGGVLSVDTASNSFVLQRPLGRQIVVKVDNNTQWQGSDSLSTIAPPTTVEVSGTIQPDGSILADAVEVLTHDKAFLGGLVLDVAPPTGDANNITMLVREELPAIPGISVPGTGTVNIGSSTVFAVRDFHLPISAFIFNRSQLVVGQRIGVGGVVNTTTTPNSVDARRIVLRRQGLDGVPGSVVVTAGNNGTFMLTNNGMFGYILGGSPIKVMTSSTTFFKGLTGLADVKNAARVRVVGLVLKDSGGNPVLVAGYVEKLS